MRHAKLTATAIVIGLLVGCSSDGTDTQVEPSAGSAAALEAFPNAPAFRRAAKCPNCEVLSVSRLALSESGTVAYAAKVRDPATENWFRVTLRENGTADGAVDSDERLRGTELALARSRRGALTRGLHERALAARASDAPVKVYFWNAVDIDYPAKETLTPETTAAFERSVDAKVQAKTAPLVAALRRRGFHVTNEGKTSPLVEAEVPLRDVLSLKDLPDVVEVGEKAEPKEGGYTWAEVDRLTDAHNGGGSGNGSKVCILEGAYPTAFEQSSLSGIIAWGNSSHTPVDSSGHCANVTGIVRSTFVRDAQVAPQASIMICGYAGTIDGGYPRCEHWCAGNGANVISMSSGFYPNAGSFFSDADMQFDWVAKRSPYPTPVVLAGNTSMGTTSVMNRGFNELIVGASDDKNTSWTSDDTIASFSNWVDPGSPNNDRELPHLVAPGVNITAAGITMSGTSQATPQVSGTVAMMQGIDTRFKTWPEMSRASVMAVAIKNIDGAALTSLPWTTDDHRDGVGLLNSSFAVSIANTAYWTLPGAAGTGLGRHAQTLTPTSFNSTTNFLSTGYQLTTTTSGRVRVVMAWDGSATCNSSGVGCTADTLDADLDLVVTDAAGNTVCTSTSADNSYEVCDFPVTTSGATYLIKPKKFSFGASSTYFSVAWFNYNPSWV